MSSKKKPVRQLVEGIGLVATPFDFPVDVCRVLHNQADIMAVGAEAPGDLAFDSTVETAMARPRCGMASDRRRQQDGAVTVPVFRIDRYDVGLGNVGGAMREVGASSEPMS